MKNEKTGLDWTGLDWTGLDWTELAWPGLAWPGLDLLNLDLENTTQKKVVKYLSVLKRSLLVQRVKRKFSIITNRKKEDILYYFRTTKSL